jgi:putative ABC transport system permease protein
MRFFPLIYAGLWRRPTRTILTGLCIAIAFLLLGLLQGVNAGFAKAIEDAHRDLLVTNTRVRGGAQLPLSSKSKIQSISGVVEVTQRANFLGTFGEPTANNRVSGPATEPEMFFRIRPFFSVPEKSLSAMRQNRDGLLATPGLLQHFGWRVGDTVTLRSQILKTDGSTDWSFKIVGTFDSFKQPGTSVFAVFNYAYFDEYRVQDRGTVDSFYERIADPTKAVATAAAIDRIFANSSHETRTRSDQVRAQYQAKQMGDVEFFTDAIMAAVLFTLAFLTGNSLRQSISERTPEFAVLKAVGWSNGRVLSLAYAEALLLYVPAAVFGLLLAYLVAPLAREEVGPVVVSPAVAMAGLACAAFLALLSVSLPALSLSRMSIVSALGRR